MAAIDFSHLSPQERLDPVGEISDSLNPDSAPVTLAQAADIKRRVATLDADIEQGGDAGDVLADLRRRHS